MGGKGRRKCGTSLAKGGRGQVTCAINATLLLNLYFELVAKCRIFSAFDFFFDSTCCVNIIKCNRRQKQVILLPVHYIFFLINQIVITYIISYQQIPLMVIVYLHLLTQYFHSIQLDFFSFFTMFSTLGYFSFRFRTMQFII